jgi:ATP-dependent RNA helicase SUPV3L1/SUV3
MLASAVEGWLTQRLKALAPLARLEAASRASEGGPELRALLIRLVEAGGVLARDEAGLDRLDPAQRTALARLGVTVGALDLFVAAMLRPGPRALLLALTGREADDAETMPPVRAASARQAPHGYRRVARQLLRVDIAEKLLREAHSLRTDQRNRAFMLDPGRAVSMGLTTASYARLLHLGGFRPMMPRPLPEGAYGPGRPLMWLWQPERRKSEPRAAAAPAEGAFAALAAMFA